MLSKLKNMMGFVEDKSTDQKDIPFNHPKINQGGSDSCPYMKKSKQQSENSSKCPVSGKNQQKKADMSDSQEEQKPRGGCPFMGGSDKKKNPSLSLNTQGYNEPFVSKFKYYLSANKLDFTAARKGVPLPLSRQIFDKYPIYLKHTLFYNGQDYKKVRGLQCCSRFMAYEQLRQKGNKYYNKGKYYQALDYYERSLSLFRWLEYHQPLNESRVSSQAAYSSQKSIDQLSQSSKIQIPLDEKPQDPADAFGQLREKYKEFFITYNDDNVRYYNGEELNQTPDLDMRKSLLVQLYLNMAAAYINLHHYSLAQQIINDGMELSDKVSQLYFRKAQCIGLSKNSNLQRLNYAKSLIQKAIQMRPNQKIFSTANANILKMLNLHDSKQAYQACLAQINEVIKIAQNKQQEIYEKVYKRAKQINLIEKRMIQQGKTPRQNLNEKSMRNSSEMKILQRMLKKYQRVIQFYTEAKNPQQIQLAKKQFQQCLRIQSQVSQIFSIKLEQKDNELGGIETEKIQKRIDIIKTRFAQDVYNSGRYNFTMLQWAIKQIVKEQAEQQKKRKAESELLNPSASVESKKGFGNLAYLLFLIPLVLIIFNYFVI